MNAIRLAQVTDASTSLVLSSVAECVDKTLAQLGPQAMAASSNVARQVLHRAERELQFKKGELLAALGEAYRKAADRYLGRNAASEQAAAKETDWTSLSLVDDAEVERGVQADRLAQQMAQGCEGQLAAISACLSSLQDEDAPPDHPLRPRVLADALLQAVAQLDSDDDLAQALTQHLGRVLSESFGSILNKVLQAWQSVGLTPPATGMARPRGLAGASSAAAALGGAMGATTRASAPGELGAARHGTHGAPATVPGAPAHHAASAMHPSALAAHTPAVHPASGHADAWGPQAQWQAAQALSQMFGLGLPAGMQPPAGMTSGTPSFSATGLMPAGGMSPGLGAAPSSWGSYAGRGQSAALANADFQDLIRQIAAAAPSSEWQGVPDVSMLQGVDVSEHTSSAWPGDAAPVQHAQGLAGPMMAVNVIRTHREALVKASGGAPVDQMVIDIVAALFDQVLSDPKVAPQMARQIARLQMPVLRVALADMGFFNSRKHPVRRFVNRIASLSAAFDDATSASGQACLHRVTELVNDVVEGDFDQIALYEDKLTELEVFVDAEIEREALEQAEVAALLQRKEQDLKVQQRFRQTLHKELQDLEMPEFLRDFLLDVWTQVQVMVAARDGAGSAPCERMRQLAHELVVSVQPKGSPQLRKAFLQTLPGLMRTLNEGLALIQWPEEAKQVFFGQLLPAHAECLKAAPAHELTQRMLEHRLLKVDRIAIPSREEAANDALPNALIDIDKPPVLTVVSALSANEAKDAGFVQEAAVVAEAPLDIELDIDVADTQPGGATDLDIDLDAPATPTHGLALIHHIQKGTAYNMQMQGQWKKVRLTWISEGRNFFIFTHGHTHKQTISLTARTLAKMCDSGRFRAFEQAELIERATQRARRQLAALSAASRDRNAA